MEFGKKIGRIRTGLLAAVLVGLLAVLAGCGGGDAQSIPEENKTAVEVAEARLGTIRDMTVVRGNVAAMEDVYVAPKAQGVVRTVSVAVGDYVRRGDTICQLDTVDLQTSLAMVKAQYDTMNTAYQEAVKNRDRYEALYKEGAVSLYQYEQAQNAVNQIGIDAVRLQVQQVQEQINNCTVKSTADGLVAEVNVHPGDMAGSSYVARVVDIDQVKLVANVTETMLGALSAGMELPVHIEAASGQDYTGVITAMPVAANATMTYPVEITIDNPEHEIMAGMFAEVDVVRSEAAEVLIIPKSAVNNEGTVYVVENGKARAAAVECGMNDDDFVEIKSGIAAGDQVVTVGAYLLSDGAAVRIVSGANGESGESAANGENGENNENSAADNSQDADAANGAN